MSESTDIPTTNSWADLDDEEDGKVEFKGLNPSASSFNPSSSSSITNTQQQITSLSVMSKADQTPSSLFKEDDAPVASLLSRISGLTTNPDPAESSSTPSTPSDPASSSTSASRPKPNTSNPLFGRALAGVKTDRPPPAQAPAQASTSASGSHQGKELIDNKQEKKEESKMSGFDNGWDEPVQNGNSNSFEDNNEKKTDTSMSEGGLISNEFQVEVKLADLQADPNSALYSAKTFEELNLHESLMKGIYSVGFKKPSKIQEVALPLLLSNPPKNLIGQSQSGTGKTAAFTLNMLSRVDPALLTPQAICLAPSRELARQIQEVVDKIGQFTDIQTHLAVPGSWSRGQKITKHILIGTPGTLVDMLSRKGTIFDPRQIRVFVLDEADEMIALQGLGDQTVRIKKMLPPGVQNVLFSATFPEEVQRFAESFAPEANKLFLKKEDVTVKAIQQLYLECDGEASKFDALSALYDCMTIGQSIVFCRTKATADNIAQRLTEEGHSVASLHGDKDSTSRDDILDGFRNGKTKVLITTNVVARGIDIQQVNMVVNYDVPDLGRDGGFRPDIETYIHRIGRTGRFGRKGCSVIFVHDDRSRDDVNYIMSELGKPMKQINAKNQDDLDELEKVS
uniref:RNA helicase n=1 Tax=Kwoniella pini CBS 10737 TaxID=1296096 RepID=A0A1B9I195_9TREE|nr:ATP-dependent RNA helicase DBP5 [Kwoniella pini CBS 10737]OCF49309.1 ATP-dependent RNA helicase DBP5 [Kwoniella pini CBS 10737]